MGASFSIIASKKKSKKKNSLCSKLVSQDWKAAEALIAKDVSELEGISSSDGQSSPLHVLVGYNPPVGLVEKFIALYPEGKCDERGGAVWKQ